MPVEGILDKMSRTLDEGKVMYSLTLGGEDIDMNGLIGKEVRIVFKNKINCTICGIEIKHSFAGRAICRNCYETAPEAEECLFYPEKCMAHLGVARDMEWSEEHCLIPHFVYLAVSSGLKVGVTRNHQIPVRWIDQGAVKAIKLAQTPNRHIAGVIEVFLKDHFADKTSWKVMLRSNSSDFDIDLLAEKRKAAQLLPDELRQYVSENNDVTGISYPFKNIPENIKAVNLEKDEEVKGILAGIKGQYLIFDNGYVLNVNRYSGYRVSMEF